MTLYDANVFLFPNPFHRYLINDRTDLHYNADGSLDLYIQASQPSDPKQAQNWLPSPPGAAFRIIWRLYQPGKARAGILDGTRLAAARRSCRATATRRRGRRHACAS